MGRPGSGPLGMSGSSRGRGQHKSQQWDVTPGSCRPVGTAGARRPLSNFTKAAALSGDMNPRFRNENILALELDMPERVTYDFVEGGGPDPCVQAAIDAAFWEDGHILLVLGSPGSAQQQLHLINGDMNSYSVQPQQQAAPAAASGGRYHQRPSSAASRRSPGPAVQL
eukprot:GHRR01034613.1.p1 GENE.GHRR01034613.1~~GHRR01034613.1.p1  ORF type:complete len:168 (+),score=67.27 GHRR01034613.1:522-1025(+)